MEEHVLNHLDLQACSWDWEVVVVYWYITVYSYLAHIHTIQLDVIISLAKTWHLTAYLLLDHFKGSLSSGIEL